MPLLDRFLPPLSQRRHWESFHAAWASAIADSLNSGLLPEGFFAEELITVGGRIEIDVASYDERPASTNAPVALAKPKSWTAPEPTHVMPAVFPDTFTVKVYRTEGGPTLVGAVELVSPGNKDRSAERRAFAIKCASYLVQGVGLVVVDTVTSRRANLHNELIALLQQAEHFKTAGHLYAAAYRPTSQDDSARFDIWLNELTLGEPLPTMPLALAADCTAPVELEKTYLDVCGRRLPREYAE